MPVLTQAPQAAALPQTVCKAILIGTPKFGRRIPTANRRIQTSRLTISRRIKSNHRRVNRMPGRNSVRVIWLEEYHPRAGKGTLPLPRVGRIRTAARQPLAVINRRSLSLRLTLRAKAIVSLLCPWLAKFQTPAGGHHDLFKPKNRLCHNNHS